MNKVKIALALALAASQLVSTTMCLAQQADLLVVNKTMNSRAQQGSLTFLNLASGKVLNRIPVGTLPTQVVMSADGRYAMVSNAGANTDAAGSLSVFDVNSQREVRRLSPGGKLNAHALIAGNGMFYFAVNGTKTIGAYNPEENKLAWIKLSEQGDEIHNLMASKDGNYLIATNKNAGSVSIFELTAEDPFAPSAWKETIVSVGAKTESLELTADGEQAWISCGDKIVMVDLKQKKVSGTFDTETQTTAHIKFSVDGKYLFVADSLNGDLIVFDATKKQAVKKLHTGNATQTIFVEPDGKHVLVGVTNEDKVTEVDLELMAVTRNIDAGKEPNSIAWMGK